MALDEVDLLAGVPAKISARVRLLGGRRVSWVEFHSVDPATPLTSMQSLTWEIAARTALEERIPLVAVVSSSGADIHEGIEASHAWGRVAVELTKCSGVVPMFAIVDNRSPVAGSSRTSVLVEPIPLLVVA